MTFAILGRTALLATRRTAVAATSQQAKRRMGSSAPAQEWTGIDKVVRGYFPKDEQREFNSTCVRGLRLANIEPRAGAPPPSEGVIRVVLAAPHLKQFLT
jgi:hypothetical protein